MGKSSIEKLEMVIRNGEVKAANLKVHQVVGKAECCLDAAEKTRKQG